MRFTSIFHRLQVIFSRFYARNSWLKIFFFNVRFFPATSASTSSPKLYTPSSFVSYHKSPKNYEFKASPSLLFIGCATGVVSLYYKSFLYTTPAFVQFVAQITSMSQKKWQKLLVKPGNSVIEWRKVVLWFKSTINNLPFHLKN